MKRLFLWIPLILMVNHAAAVPKQEAREALDRATGFLRSISTHGGYAGIYSKDLSERFGEALYEEARENEIWVQPPGTPTVGETFLMAYHATGDSQFLDAAREAGRALVWGQRREGGWDHRVAVDHMDPEAATPERKSGHSTFDDEITQGAVSFLMKLDEVIDEPWLTDGVELGLQFILDAQFDNGAWPQWYPLRGGYHDYYTFNDAAINDCIRVLIDAHKRYGKEAYLDGAKQGGEFIIRSQLPQPQAGWAQQYSHDLKPAKARGFEPAGVCTLVTTRNIHTLIDLYAYTNNARFLEPIPAAIDWLRESTIGPRRWARLYEVDTNRPIYGDRQSDQEVIYDYDRISRDERSSYGWQGSFGIPGAVARYSALREREPHAVPSAQTAWIERAAPERPSDRSPSQEAAVREVIESLDSRGRWINEEERIRIRDYVRNLRLLCRYIE